MARRLNDTASLATRPFEAGESHSISTRKIDNGYLTCTSTYNPRTGECRSAETFSRNPPRIIAPRVDGRSGANPDSGNSLRGAKDYLGQ